mgnify:CR=1 FL=1
MEIAAQLGLSKAILSRARDLLDKKELQVEDYLEDIEGADNAKDMAGAMNR